MPQIKLPFKISFPWIVILPFILYCFHLLLFGDWLSDDAGISFAYARNFIHGHGFVSQAGASPLEGFSNFLWTLFLAPLFIGDPVDPTIMVKVISAGLILITYILIYTAISKNFITIPYKNLSIFVILLLLSINSSFVIWTSSGLENPLYAMLSVLYFLLILKYNRTVQPNYPLPAVIAFIAVLLALTRPDGILFALIFPVCLIFSLIFKRQKIAFTHLLLYLAFATVLFGGFLLFRYFYFHDFFPNAYHAKSSPGLNLLPYLIFIAEIYVIKSYELLFSVFSLRAGIFTIVLIVISTVVFLKSKSRRENLVLLLMTLTSWAIYILLPLDWMGEFRFATPFFIFLYIFLWLIIMQTLQLTIRREKIKQLFVLVAVLYFILSSAVIYISRSTAFSRDPSTSFKGIALRSGIRFNDYADLLHIKEASLLCADMGGTLYFSRHRVIDLAGLCDRKIAGLLHKNKQGLKDYVLDDLKPTFIHIRNVWSIFSDFEYDFRFRRDYIPLTETISDIVSAKEPEKVFHSGDYVRKDALPEPGLLQRVNEYLRGAKNHRFNSIDKKKLRPFPRG